MTHRTGRNEPCPCGSGRKYKHCCLHASQPHDDDPSAVVSRALVWLRSCHGRAVNDAIDSALFDDLNGEEGQCYDDLDEETRSFITNQAYEWLLAEGEIQVRGQPRRVAELLLAPGGPPMTDAQRAWLAQLAATPLRLYVVTGVKPGESMTLCDARDVNADPITVSEHMGSTMDLLDTHIGVRVMSADGISTLSGMMYSFSRAQAEHLLQWFREYAEELAPQPLPDTETSFMIRRAWLAQFLEEPEPPTLMDYHSNEPLLFVIDRYRVRDWEKVAAVLAMQPDVEGNRDRGWQRSVHCEDGQTRSAAGITRTRDAQHLTVFYRTQRYADEGRNWFDTIMGDAVEFRIREIQDPIGALSHTTHDEAPPTPASDVPTELATPAIREALRRVYANWADEPLPALGERSPREAIASRGGLERVKGLLRGYQHGEELQAQLQQREPVSLQFLWEALGLAPE